MSAANSEMVNRLAFVGNLPPDATQEEMKQLCSQVGEVILFRIVYDRETGKPKGYGFCEYRDPKLVDVAVDLLNEFEHRGSKLYVSKANSKHQHPNRPNDSGHGGSNSGTPSNKPPKKKQRKPSSKRKSVDEITRVVSSFSTSEKREILSQMKVLIEQNEKGAKDILLENPQLAQALLLIQMEFNLVKTTDIHALTKAVSNEVPQPKPKPKPKAKQQPTQSQQSQQSQQSTNTAQQQPTPQTPPKQSVKSQQAQPQIKPPSNTNNNDNDVQMNNNNNTVNPKPAATNKVNEDRLKGLSSQQQSVLGRVMKMTPEQIAALPPDVQRQIRAVQAQLAKRQKQ